MGNRSDKERHRPYVSAGIAALTALSEAELQAKVVEPLLRRLGFTHVRNKSGPGEHGKDLIAIKEEFGKAKLYAIQIKKLRPTGKQSDRRAFGQLLTQLRQAILEDVTDPMTNVPRPPDRCYFITPYEIPPAALDSAINQLRETERREITVIDGPILMDQLLKHKMIDVIRTIGGMELQYRTQFALAVGRIPESHVFGVPEGLELDQVYVEMALEQEYEDLARPLQIKTSSGGTKILTGMPKEIRAFDSCCRIWDISGVWCPPRRASARRAANARAALKRRKNLLRERIKKLEEARIAVDHLGRRKEEVLSSKERSLLKRSRRILEQRAYDLDHKRTRTITEMLGDLARIGQLKVFEFDSDALLRTIRNELRMYVHDLSRLATQDLAERECTAIIRRGIQLAGKISNTKAVTHLRNLWWAEGENGRSDGAKSSEALPDIPADKLAKIKVPAYVVGPPGSGKTTLLRRLAQSFARNPDADLPILLYMVRVKDPSEKGLTAACLEALSEQGYKTTKQKFRDALKKGNYFFLFDGLDEAGEKAPGINNVIGRLSKKYDKCGLIVSTRDTFDFGDLENAIKVRVLPFTSEQLDTFLENWFTASPTGLKGIKAWLEANPDMCEAAKIPLIAALLCSLYAADAEMPATETELYQERFELLLGKWEQAKGIQPMPVNLRKRYWHFLMSLAITMHRKGSRSIRQSDVVRVAKGYYLKKYHKSPDALVTDCIHRGLLEKDKSGDLSCGHLTYQEFLVARWLADRNDLQIVWKNLLNPWWKKAIEFYASLKQDISPLIKEGINRRINGAIFRRVEDLVELAPLTSDALYLRFRKLPWT